MTVLLPIRLENYSKGVCLIAYTIAHIIAAIISTTSSQILIWEVIMGGKLKYYLSFFNGFIHD